MSTQPVIEIDSLLEPISTEWPQGIDLRLERSPTSDYYTIKDARNAARAAERSSMFEDHETDLLSSWKVVTNIAPKILRNTSKDLEIACWYLEGLIRLEGAAGLRDGISLIHKLIDNYWDNLYPQPDEDGIETKVSPLTGLNGDGGDGTLIVPIRNIPLTQENEFGTFNFWQYQQARNADRIADDDEKQTRIDALGYSLANITSTVGSTNAADCLTIVKTLEECLENFKSLSTRLREICGQDAPPTTNISKLLDEILRTARFLYKDKIDSIQPNTAETESEGAANEVKSADSRHTTGSVMPHIREPGGVITHREEALRRLEEVAHYFRQFEPHSPIAPGLERIVSWGRLTVSELMMQLLPDDQARGAYSQLTGVSLDGSDTKPYIAPTVAKIETPITAESHATPHENNTSAQNSSDVSW